MTTLMWQRLAPTAKFTVLALVTLILTFCSAGSIRAQDAAESHRKVLTRIAPEYPSMGRMLNIRGSVKLEAVVSPNGTVKTAEVKGGHPVLAQAALNAVYKWKWEPAAKESHEPVVVQFNPE